METWINTKCGPSSHVEGTKACNGALGGACGLSACWRGNGSPRLRRVAGLRG